MIKCIIVDDEPMAIKVLETHLSQLHTIDIVATHNSATKAFTTLQSTPVDLIFLDLQMPSMSGFSLLKTLPQYPHVIITTAHREYALESYDFKITDYLLKPISFPRLLKALGKITNPPPPLPANNINQNQETQESGFFYIQSERQFHKILLKEILYIESLRNHIRIVTADKKFTTLISISEINQKLPEDEFARIHRSYIVALKKIECFNHSSVQIGKNTIPIGKVFKNEFLKRLNDKVL